jgi:hypothetical protein
MVDSSRYEHGVIIPGGTDELTGHPRSRTPKRTYSNMVCQTRRG